MSSLSQLQEEKQDNGSLSKNNQPVWPLSCKKKSTHELGGKFLHKHQKSLAGSRQKIIYLCTWLQAENKTKQPTCLCKPGKQTINLFGLFRCKNKRTISLCGNSKKTKQNNGGKSPQVGKTTMINMCRLLPPQARKKLWLPVGGKQSTCMACATRGKSNQHVSWVVGLCKWGTTISL